MSGTRAGRNEDTGEGREGGQVKKRSVVLLSSIFADSMGIPGAEESSEELASQVRASLINRLTPSRADFRSVRGPLTCHCFR